jgi:hypothetical protein
MRPHSIGPQERSRPATGAIPPSVPCILFLLLTISIGLPFAVVLPDRPRVGPAVTAPQVEVRIAAEGYDSSHRRLPFTIYVLSQDFTWKLESTSELQGSDSLVGPDLAAAVNRAYDVFCVGTASFEGGVRREEARAWQRAETLAGWVRPVIADPDRTRVYTLNAGQYVGPEAVESPSQRKAILIATGAHETGVNLGEALRAGMAGLEHTTEVVYHLLHHYSRSGEWLDGPCPGQTRAGDARSVTGGPKNSGHSRFSALRYR